MKKRDIRGFAKQLTALMLTAAMVLSPMGGGMQSTAASQDFATVTVAEKADKSATDTVDADNAEHADRQSEQEAANANVSGKADSGRTIFAH